MYNSWLTASISSLFGAGQTMTLNPLFSLMLFLVLAVVPVMALAVTSFVKVSVVLSVLRSAIGAGQVPSGAIIAVLAIVLSVHIMAPVGCKMWDQFQQGVSEGAQASPKKRSEIVTVPTLCEATVEMSPPMASVLCGLTMAAQPLRAFLVRCSGEKERRFFFELSRSRGSRAGESDFGNLLPAFMISELHSAFKMGVIVFLPFLVVDVVITNLLVALGMTMVNPLSISLPLKLLVFVSSNGWFILCRGLVLSYG
jgi:type III secretion protein R